jgi:hypothetical protein
VVYRLYCRYSVCTCVSILIGWLSTLVYEAYTGYTTDNGLFEFYAIGIIVGTGIIIIGSCICIVIIFM